jgi:activating signal cointegrator 1
VKAWSLWQPWATLVALGEKRIETRSRPMKYRGPLAIHAALTTKGFDLLTGDCDGKQEGDWRYGYIGDWQASYCFRTGDEGTRGDAEMVNLEDGGHVALPLGAVVAKANMTECLHITAWNPTPMMLGETLPRWAARLLDVPGEMLVRDYLDVPRVPPGDPEAEDLTDEIPYGDFTPGRYGYLLADIEALPEPVPAKGKQGLWEWTGDAL